MSNAINVAYEEFLESAILSLQEEVKFQKSLLDSFWTGDVPDDATLDHMVIAKAGRQRLEEKAKRCALLSA